METMGQRFRQNERQVQVCLCVTDMCEKHLNRGGGGQAGERFFLFCFHSFTHPFILRNH